MATAATKAIIHNLREAAAIVKDAGFGEEAEEMNKLIRFFRTGVVDDNTPLMFDGRLGFDTQANKIGDLLDFFEGLDD